MAASRTTTKRAPDTVSSASVKTTSPTRRQALISLGGTAALLPGTTDAATGDEPLMALWAEYRRLEALCREAYRTVDNVGDLAGQQYPERHPSTLGRREIANADGTTAYKHFQLSRADIQRMIDREMAFGRKPGSTWVAPLERRLQRLVEWEDACTEVDAAHKIPELTKVAEDYSAQVAEVKNCIIDTPHRTDRGLLIKLQLADQIEGFSDPDMQDRSDIGVTGRVVVSLIHGMKRAA